MDHYHVELDGNLTDLITEIYQWMLGEAYSGNTYFLILGFTKNQNQNACDFLLQYGYLNNNFVTKTNTIAELMNCIRTDVYDP